MITIHLINGDKIEIDEANYQIQNSVGTTDFYAGSNKERYLGTLTRTGNFIDAHNSKQYPVRYIRNRGNTVEDMISRIGNRDKFTWQENEAIGKLKKLLEHVYLPKSGRYKV